MAALRGLRAVAAAIGVHPGERYRHELLQGARMPSIRTIMIKPDLCMPIRF